MNLFQTDVPVVILLKLLNPDEYNRKIERGERERERERERRERGDEEGEGGGEWVTWSMFLRKVMSGGEVVRRFSRNQFR